MVTWQHKSEEEWGRTWSLVKEIIDSTVPGLYIGIGWPHGSFHKWTRLSSLLLCCPSVHLLSSIVSYRGKGRQWIWWAFPRIQSFVETDKCRILVNKVAYIKEETVNMISPPLGQSATSFMNSSFLNCCCNSVPVCVICKNTVVSWIAPLDSCKFWKSNQQCLGYHT